MVLVYSRRRRFFVDVVAQKRQLCHICARRKKCRPRTCLLRSIFYYFFDIHLFYCYCHLMSFVDIGCNFVPLFVVVVVLQLVLLLYISIIIKLKSNSIAFNMDREFVKAVFSVKKIKRSTKLSMIRSYITCLSTQKFNLIKYIKKVRYKKYISTKS